MSVVDTARTVSNDRQDFQDDRGTRGDSREMVLHGTNSSDGIFRTDGEGDTMNWYFVRPSNQGGIHSFSVSKDQKEIFAVYEAISILAEADPTFAKAQEDMTIYYD